MGFARARPPQTATVLDESYLVRRLIAIVFSGLLLVLTGCSAGNSSSASSATAEPTSQSSGQVAALDSVKVTVEDKTKAPKVDFKKPLSVSEPTIKLVKDGDGDRVKAGQSVVLRYVIFNGNDGSVLEDYYKQPKGEALEVGDDLKQGNAMVYNALVGAKVGSQIAFAVPGQASSAAPSPSASPSAAPAGPSQLMVLEIESVKDTVKPLTKPEGDKVTPPAGLPTVAEDAKGVPTITVPKTAAPNKLVAQDLIKGKGAQVQASDTIVANYVGVTYSDGKKFDSSFDRGQAATFPLNGVIKGWTQGLTGKTVGSRVLLVIPADLAYGNGGSGKPKGTLVFVVDILGVK